MINIKKMREKKFSHFFYLIYKNYLILVVIVDNISDTIGRKISFSEIGNSTSIV